MSSDHVLDFDDSPKEKVDDKIISTHENL